MIFEILFILALLIIFYANIMVRNYAKKLSQDETKLSGFEVAKLTSDNFAEKEPHIIKKEGRYLDHYDNDRNVIKLTPEVFDGNNKYSKVIAFFTAIKSSKKFKNINFYLKNKDFIVMGSYLIIIVGAFLNNGLAIYIGMSTFILAIVIDLILVSLFVKNLKSNNEVIEFIKKQELNINIEEDIKIIAYKELATIFYSFINNFR